MPTRRLPHFPTPAVDHRPVLLASSAAAAVLGLHRLRRAFKDTIAERDEALRQVQVLARAASELNAIPEPDRVIATGVRLAAEMASPQGARARRANYCRITGDTVRVEAEFDTEGDWLGATWPLAEHPHLAQVVRTRRALAGRLDPGGLGPTVRALSQSQGVGYGAWVPVVVNEQLHGVLAVAGRGRPVSDRELSRSVAIAQIMELALSNALTHQELKRAALTDPLTSLPNRRGLDSVVSERSGPEPLTVLAIDIDGLKRINDHDGHAAGDEMLLTVANSISGVLRAEDVVARIGGDEFVCVLFGSSLDSAVHVAERLLGSDGSFDEHHRTPRLSIGVAFSGPHEPLEHAVWRADMAMYDAKREGGMRYRVAHPVAVADLSDRGDAA